MSHPTLTLTHLTDIYQRLSNKQYLAILWILYTHGHLYVGDIANLVDGDTLRSNRILATLEEVNLLKRVRVTKLLNFPGRFTATVHLNNDMLPYYVRGFSDIEKDPEILEYEQKYQMLKEKRLLFRQKYTLGE